MSKRHKAASALANAIHFAANERPCTKIKFETAWFALEYAFMIAICVILSQLVVFLALLEASKMIQGVIAIIRLAFFN